MSEVVARQIINARECASGGLGPRDNIGKGQVRQISAISAELTPQLNHVKWLALESTGIIAERSQGLELHSLQYNAF
jgi:hypothetical protein